ncbi:MAG: AEC family transporter [Verrucomicrobiota bacterium]
MTPFLASFQATFLAVAQIGLMIIASGWLVRRDIIDKRSIKAISNAVIYLFLPCLIFSNITIKLDTESLPDWWLFPLSACAIAVVGWTLAAGLSKFRKEVSPTVIPLSFLQNAGYLILPLGQAILKEDFGRFALICFLFILAHNALLWGIGKLYLSREDSQPLNWKSIISPPLIANLSALALSLTGLRDYIPSFFIDTASFIGEGAIPLGTFVLGASLGSLSFNLKPYLKDCIQVNIQKLIFMPLLMLLAMEFIPWLTSDPIIALLFILQAASAPATGLMLQAQSFGRNAERVSAVLFTSYLLCGVTIPLWTALAIARHG